MPRKQHTKQFKLDAINYPKEHPDLTQLQCAKNLEASGEERLSYLINEYHETNRSIDKILNHNFSTDVPEES